MSLGRFLSVEILHNPERGGYPAEYLAARIGSRRAYLIDDWDAVILAQNPLEYISSRRYGDLRPGETSDGIRGYCRRELRWVYFQMDTDVRTAFRPYFLNGEIGNLFVCLRHKDSGEEDRIGEDLAFSLLSEGMKRLLKDGKDVASCIAGLERAFLSLSGRFKDLGEAFSKEGLRGFERRLTDNCLECAVSLRLHPALRDFFVYLIDSRNITALYKELRWNIPGSTHVVRGGSIDEQELKAVFEKGRVSGLSSLLQRLTHIGADQTGERGVENILLRGLTRKLRKAGRESTVGLILDYLWRCRMEERNVRVIVHGKDIHRGTISRELVE